jgi:prepilin-type N-terminal cleavage/methylation domain-containing protein/prepilin-type processing-associated H-X9-DG protein
MKRHVHDAKRGAGGVTLVELLVVVSIIGVLMAMLLPAVNSARESGRQTACQSNLRDIGVGLQAHASRRGAYCSGAFDWRRDGCVTEIGWVADLVNNGVPAGKLLCPSNPAQISETYNDLLGMDPTIDACVDRLGSDPKILPDGSLSNNPCRRLAGLVPGSDERRVVVEQQVYKGQYNTNYTATWWLVRSGVRLDDSGNLMSFGGCGGSTLARASTFGPLTQVRSDSSAVPSSFLPVMGCGASSGTLQQNIGLVAAGQPVAKSFTAGPVLAVDVNYSGASATALNPPPTFAAGTPRGGALGTGWWAAWNATLQDYRGLAPVHRKTCNLLFADGSVRSYADLNNDGLLNNGLPAGGGFSSANVELPPEEVFSGWTLSGQ